MIIFFIIFGILLMVIKMNISIKDSVLQNLREENLDIKAVIDESVLSNDELTLPGLGVIIGLFWNDLSNEEKDNIVGIIKAKLS